MPTISVTAAEAARNPNALVDAISAGRALASRERQSAAEAKRSAPKKISLAAPALSSEADIVLSRRADYARSEADRLAARPAAVKLGKGLKITGVDSEGKAFEDATPERINQARAGGEIGVVAGVREITDPFATLYKKRILDKDPKVNECMFQAGLTFRQHHHSADLGGVKAMDLMKDIVDGGIGNAGCPITDHSMDARRKFREATAAVGTRLLPYLMGVVIEDRTVESLCGLVADSKSARLSEVIAMERLRECLHRLCDLWKIHANDKPQAISSSNGIDNVRDFERRGRKAA